MQTSQADLAKHVKGLTLLTIVCLAGGIYFGAVAVHCIQKFVYLQPGAPVSQALATAYYEMAKIAIYRMLPAASFVTLTAAFIFFRIRQQLTRLLKDCDNVDK